MPRSRRRSFRGRGKGSGKKSRASKVKRVLTSAKRALHRAARAARHRREDGKTEPRYSSYDFEIDLHTMDVVRGTPNPGVHRVLQIIARDVPSPSGRQALLELLTSNTAFFETRGKGAQARVVAHVKRFHIDPLLQHESFEQFRDARRAFGLGEDFVDRHQLLSLAYGQPSIVPRSRGWSTAPVVGDLQARAQQRWARRPPPIPTSLSGEDLRKLAEAASA